MLTTLFVLGAGCTPRSEGPTVPPTASVATTSTVSPTTTAPATTTTEPLSGFRFYKVDPRTLEPLRGFEPIHTGDTHGLVSPNGRWVVLEDWGEGWWLIDTESWEVAARLNRWGSLMEVRDDGTVYAISWEPTTLIYRMTPGADDWEEVVTVESGANLWTVPTFLDDHRMAARGFSEGIYVDGGDLTVNVIDTSTGGWTQIPVQGAWTPSEPTGIVIDGYEITSHDDPAVVFTSDRAFVVHAHEDVVSEVDLGTGAVARHHFEPKSSLLQSLAAWFAPKAAAKGPAPGVRRTAVVSNDGSKLYVSGYRTEVFSEEGQLKETTQPLGVQVIDTESWQVEETLDLPVGTLYLSPDGRLLLGTGHSADGYPTGWHWYTGSGIFVIDTKTLETTHFDGEGDEFEASIEFSADGSYAYLGRDTTIEVLDLERLEIIAETSSTRPLQVWGAAGVVSEWLGP